MKKILALIVAMLLVMSMVSAFAANTTITINDTTTIGESTEHRAAHTYTVYQVFTGDVEGTMLKNVKYGSDYTGKSGDVPQAELDAITDAAAFARTWLAGTHGNGTTVANGESLTVPTGYYIIVDSADELAEGDALSANMVKIVGETTITPKKGTTTDTKIITTDTLGTGTANEINGDVDNVSIGDTVNYQITANVPSEAVYYNYYYFVITDTMSNGLTLNQDSFVVKAGETTLAPADYVIEKAANTEAEAPNIYGRTGKLTDGYTFKIGLVDAKAHAGETITVTYSAILNEDAELDENPNDNTSKVIYSNNPNNTYNGDGTHNGIPAEITPNAFGETPDSTTHTYSTRIKIVKVDQNGNPLKGAGFTLTGNSLQTVVTLKDTFTAAEDGTYYKLADGSYTTTAPKTETTMKPMGTADASVTAGYVVAEADFPGTTETVGGVVYRAYDKATDIGKLYFVKENNNNFLYADPTQKYKKTQNKEVEDVSTDLSIEKMVDDAGIVEFDGLGAGTDYVIHESTVPNGYNGIEDISFGIKFTEDGTPKWSVDPANAKVEYDSTNKIFIVTIQNQKGTTLPTTGGIGTTLFYVGGSILVLLAVILLVTKRRMNANND